MLDLSHKGEAAQRPSQGTESNGKRQNQNIGVWREEVVCERVMGEKGDGGGKLREEETRRAGLNRAKELKGRRRE